MCFSQRPYPAAGHMPSSHKFLDIDTTDRPRCSFCCGTVHDFLENLIPALSVEAALSNLLPGAKEEKRAEPMV